mmetsp:Transcript_52606/g.163350  ORF Transcript_52606/g.163350 Transcript_52606/m.163350 type:complete len:240 (+) Transcript_52606:795-1514(+)
MRGLRGAVPVPGGRLAAPIRQPRARQRGVLRGALPSGDGDVHPLGRVARIQCGFHPKPGPSGRSHGCGSGLEFHAGGERGRVGFSSVVVPPATESGHHPPVQWGALWTGRHHSGVRRGHGGRLLHNWHVCWFVDFPWVELLAAAFQDGRSSLCHSRPRFLRALRRVGHGSLHPGLRGLGLGRGRYAGASAPVRPGARRAPAARGAGMGRPHPDLVDGLHLPGPLEHLRHLRDLALPGGC